jgi:hypothetical protein
LIHISDFEGSFIPASRSWKLSKMSTLHRINTIIGQFCHVLHPILDQKVVHPN